MAELNSRVWFGSWDWTLSRMRFPSSPAVIIYLFFKFSITTLRIDRNKWTSSMQPFFIFIINLQNLTLKVMFWAYPFTSYWLPGRNRETVVRLRKTFCSWNMNLLALFNVIIVEKLSYTHGSARWAEVRNIVEIINVMKAKKNSRPGPQDRLGWRCSGDCSYNCRWTRPSNRARHRCLNGKFLCKWSKL